MTDSNPQNNLNSQETTSALSNRPEQEAEKIRSMFDRISGAYDLLNRVLAFGIDQRWRKKAIRSLGSPDELTGLKCLDLCAGTCDMTIELMRQSAGKVHGVTALDFSPEMLRLAEIKLKKRSLEKSVTLIEGDATKLPLKNETFNRAMVAFGIRNVSDVPLALSEAFRVLTKDGVFAILEFSRPRNRLVGALYSFYFRYVLPSIGAIISGDGEAYRYLNQSAEAFPDGEDFTRLLSEAGFAKVKYQPLTFGIVTLYIAQKSNTPSNAVQ